MPNFSSLARLEVPEKFVWWVGGGVCKVIFMVNPTVVLRLGLGWGFDNLTARLRKLIFVVFQDTRKLLIFSTCTG